jgi:hypothetical protein
MSKKSLDEEYEFLSIKVDRFDFAVGESINVDLRTGRPWELSDDDPVVTPVMRIELVGTAIYPESRANDVYSITIYEDGSGRNHQSLKDRACNHSPARRTIFSCVLVRRWTVATMIAV